MAVDGPDVELRELGEGDIADFVRLSRRSFGFPATPPPQPERLSGETTRHGAFLAGRLVGQAFDLHDRQWWGGDLVAAADVAGVAVAPEARGNGVARRLIRRLLEHAKDRGAVVSALFPTIATVYRQFGWAVAGSIDVVDMPTAALPTWPSPARVAVREGTAADIPATHALYRRIAATRNGMLSRDEERHRHGDQLPGGIDGLTVVEVDGEIAGYATWARGSGYGPDAVLTVYDALAATPDAARALVSVLSGWHTVVGTVRLRLLHGDAISDIVPLGLGRPHSTKQWMHRPVDLAGAVAARGWPAGVSGRAVFGVEDTMAPWNTGTWAIEVDGGKAELRRTNGDTSVHLTVNGFAMLYCGLTTAASLREAGHLSGPHADAAALDVLSTSVPPRLLDNF